MLGVDNRTIYTKKKRRKKSRVTVQSKGKNKNTKESITHNVCPSKDNVDYTSPKKKKKKKRKGTLPENVCTRERERRRCLIV